MEAAFIEEVLRINDRFLTEVVEAEDVCPYARPARVAGEVTRRVLADVAPDPASALEVIAELERAPRIAIGLLIYPRLEVHFGAFDALVDAVRRTDLDRRGGRSAPFALAPFHPQARFATATPAQLTLFFRRAPDPTIQLVRFSALDAVKRGDRAGGKFLLDFSPRGLAELERRSELGVSERIAAANFARVQVGGLDRLTALLDDIAADRARSYARFYPGARTLP